jgi:nucleotide-binding universal stress UspA family protein
MERLWLVVSMQASDAATATAAIDENASKHRIVVGVDGSPSSIDALRWAEQIGTAVGTEIDAVISWDFPQSYGYAPVTMDYRPDQDAEHALAEALTAAFGEKRPIGLRALVRQGHPAETLIRAGRGARMLVVGSRGHGGFVGLLLGSVSAYCAEHGTCPVVIIHSDTEAGQK